MEIVLTISHLLAFGVGLYIAKVLRIELKSKKEVISDHEKRLKSQQDYIDKFDWQAATKHYEEYVIPLERQKLTEELKKKHREEFLETMKQVDEEMRFSARLYEMQGYLFALFNWYERDNPGSARRICEKHLPNSAQYFQGIWKDAMRHNDDSQNNEPLK